MSRNSSKEKKRKRLFFRWNLPIVRKDSIVSWVSLESGFRRDISAISLGLSLSLVNVFMVYAMFWFCVSLSNDRKSYIQFWLWPELIARHWINCTSHRSVPKGLPQTRSCEVSFVHLSYVGQMKEIIFPKLRVHIKDNWQQLADCMTLTLIRMVYRNVRLNSLPYLVEIHGARRKGHD